MRLAFALSLIPAALTIACVETMTPPEPTAQVQVPYGPKIYLKDSTQNSGVQRCTLIGDVVTSSSSGTATITVDGVDLEDDSRAFNCYVKVTPGSVTVDTLEATTFQYQLCYDSEVCLEPNPADQKKAVVCTSEESYDRCPIVGIPQFEAARYCEFMGKRLPTGIEALIMRQPNQPQEPGEVNKFPNGPTAPPCNAGILFGCDPNMDMGVGTESQQRPQPMGVDASNKLIGAAPLDKTEQGVYDLTGNATEWTSDFEFVKRTADLPWFCTAPLPEGQAEPTCPDGEVCIYGTYRHSSDGQLRERPVCLTRASLQFANGTLGVSMGGGIGAKSDSIQLAGTFARTVRAEANAKSADLKNADVGIRCVGTPGTPDANGITAVR